MAESESGLTIPISFTLDTTNVEAFEERMKRGINAPVNVGGAGAPTRQGGTTPPPASPAGRPGPGVTGAATDVFQQSVNEAWARGDSGSARRLTAQAQAYGLNVVQPAQADPGYRSRSARVERSWEQASFAQFKDERRSEERIMKAREREAAAAERNAQREEARAQRTAIRTRDAEFDAGLSDMEPNAQRRALLERAGNETDPIRQAGLTRRANALRGRTGLNTELFGTGQYMNFLFGSLELTQALQQQRQAQIQSSVAETDIERMNIRAKAASESAGIFGGIVVSAWNPIAQLFGFRSPGKAAETASLQTRRRASQDTIRASQFRRADERALLDVVDESDYRIGTEKARIQQEGRHRSANQRWQDLQGQQYETDDDEVKQSIRAEQRELVAEKSAADFERAATERILGRASRLAARSQWFGVGARNDIFTGNTLRGTIKALDAKFDPMRSGRMVTGFAGKQFRDAEGTRLPGIADADYTQFTSNLHDYLSQTDTATIQDRQRTILSQSTHRTMQFANSYQPMLAQLQQVAGQWGVAKEAADSPEARARIDQEARDQTISIMQARSNEKRGIGINLGGREQQIAALMNRDAVSAGVAGIVASTRSEEMSLRMRGLRSEADRARRLGQSTLELEKKDYLESFVGQQVSKDFAMAAGMGLLPKSAEDPGAVLKNIESAMNDLKQPGTVAGDKLPDLMQEMVDEFKGFADKFLAALSN